MARNLFGGSAADVAEDIDGSRVSGATGLVYDGPGSEAAQLTDLLNFNNQPIISLTSNAEGMVEHFYGPDNVTLLYVDFGAGRVALTPVNTSTDLANHLNEEDPHGSKADALAEITAQKGTANGIATLDPSGKVPANQLPALSGDGSGGTHWHNVKNNPYGALGDGTTDDTAKIQAAIDAAGYGGVVYFPPGVYLVSYPLDLPRGVTLQGSHSNLMVGPGMVGDEWACYLQAAPTFTTGAMITIIGEDDGDHPAINGEQRLTNLMLDGSKVPTGSLDGIYSKGNVQNVVLRDVCIRQMPNNGIITAGATNGDWPYSWRLHSVMVDNCHVNGIVLERNTDLTLEDCQVIGCWSTGIKLTNCANTIVTHSRVEWCGNYGFHLTGGWGNWPGSGSMTMTGCSTDRNGWDGVRIDASGNGAFLVQGLMTRRDGRNGGAGGGGYAGLRLSNQAPVVVTGHTNYVGSDDGGTANTSPDYGTVITGARDVQYSGAYLHGFLASLYDDDTSTRVTLGPNVSGVAGNNFAEDRKAVPAQVSDLSVTGRALGEPHPADHGLKAWSYDSVNAVSSLVTVAGTVFLSAVHIPARTTVSKILWHVSNNGVTATAAANYVGLYDSTGVRLASVDVTSAVTAIGFKSTAITPVVLQPGLYWIAWVFNATTPPAMPRTTAVSGSTTLVNANLTASTFRFATNGTGQTTLPATINPANNVAGPSYWAALG